MNKTKNKYNQKSIYVPDKYMDFYDMLCEEAEESDSGVGAHICRELIRYRDEEHARIKDMMKPPIKL